eukprot:scaffold70573_cov31-Phaeocystis_antarctica.AAC.1
MEFFAEHLALGMAAWSKVLPLADRETRSLSRGSAPARLLRLLSVRLVALGSSALPGCGPATGRPATASGAPASLLQSR